MICKLKVKTNDMDKNILEYNTIIVLDLNFQGYGDRSSGCSYWVLVICDDQLMQLPAKDFWDNIEYYIASIPAVEMSGDIQMRPKMQSW